MKKLSIYLIVVAALFATSSCQKFLDVNDDKDRPFTSTPDSLLPVILGNLSTSYYEHGEISAYLTQQVATLSGWDKYRDRWDYVDANRVAQWRRHYHDIGINVMHVLESSGRYEDEGNGSAENYKAVAKIVYASSLLLTTDIFGDIAYKEAFVGKPYAKYDSQEFIYSEIDKLLDDGIAHAKNSKSASNLLNMDLGIDNVNGGDMDKWIAFAYAIKARRAIHLLNEPGQDYSKVITYVDEALNTYSFETTGYHYENGSSTNAFQINQWGPTIARPSWDYQANQLNASAVTDFFLGKGLNYDMIGNVVRDPRTRKLIPNIDSLDYKYVVSGDGRPDGTSNNDFPTLYGSYMTEDDALQPFITKEELYFIRAEAYLQSGDKANALIDFDKGIRENMLNAGVETGVDQYLGNSSFFPQAAADLDLTDVMMQKYVALWLQGEVWVDMRRHGHGEVYTGLTKPTNLIDYFETGSEWIERFPYDTETEEIYNKPQLIEMGAFQSREWLKKKMIWAKGYTK